MPSEKRKAKKQQYFNAVKKSRKYEKGLILREGMVGFLITCNNREREAVKEGYNILNEYADKLFGPEVKPDVHNKDSDGDDDDCDIDKALDKEKEMLKAAHDKKPAERRFQQVESGANNCIFIRTTLSDPGRIMETLITDIQNSQEQKNRFIMRMLPILGTCKAYEKNIEELAEKILPESLKSVSSTSSSYSVLFKARNTNQVSKEDVYKIIGGVMKNTLANQFHLDLKTPDVCIIVEVLRTVCCIGVVNNFYERKKYNLLELVKKESDKSNEINKEPIKDIEGEETKTKNIESNELSTGNIKDVEKGETVDDPA